ncbi:MAG: PAS domain-containing protein, partial [Gammaproteobacteria bacterium]
MRSAASGKLPSIRSKIAMLVLACAVPAVLGFAALAVDAHTRQREQLVHDAERSAQALLVSVERELSASRGAARALAGSPSLAAGDLAAFRRQASAVLGEDAPADAFLLSDAHGRPLMHTGVPEGAPLPANPHAAVVAQVAASGREAVSDLYDLGNGERIVSVEVPVVQEDGRGPVKYVLTAQLRLQRLNVLLREMHLPAGWNAQVFDSAAVFVARSRNPERVLGQRAYAPLLQALARSDSGMVELLSREGVPMMSAYRRSARLGWTVSVGVPQAASRGALNATLPRMLAAIGTLLAVGIATAWVIGGAIARSVRALCGPAVALGRGEPLAIAGVTIREPAEVADALRQVDGELQGYRHELERMVAARTAELQRSNALLDTIYGSAQVGMMLVDVDLRIAMMNDYLIGVLGIGDLPYQQRSLADVFGAQGMEYEALFRQVRDSGVALNAIEVASVARDDPGPERHWIASYHPVRGADGQLVGVSCVAVDVTERRMLSQRLRDVTEQFRAIYDMSGDAHVLLALGAGFIGGNQAAARMFGCASVEEFVTLSPATTSPEFQPD